ncbi:hypothetical protein ES703_14027 [subsurface metagenome]
MTFDHVELEPEKTILGIVAIPNEPDCSGQTLSREVINKAMTLYNDHFNNILLQHLDTRGREPDFTQVANIQTLDNWGFTFNDRVKIINSFQTSEDSLIETQPVVGGTWVMELAVDEAIQEKIDKGKLTGLSYGGAGCLFPVNSHKQILSLMPGEVSLVNRACNRRQWLRKAEAEVLRKPLSGWHSCRLKNPETMQADSFKTIEQELKDGRKVNIIIARPKGKEKITAQAIRYPVGQFTEKESRRRCLEKSGTFEPAKENNK